MDSGIKKPDISPQNNEKTMSWASSQVSLPPDSDPRRTEAPEMKEQKKAATRLGSRMCKSGLD